MKKNYYKCWLNINQSKHPLFEIIYSIIVWLVVGIIAFLNLHDCSLNESLNIFCWCIMLIWSLLGLSFWIKLAVSGCYYYFTNNDKA